MTSHAPGHALLRTLLRHHAALRRAWIGRHALRAAAAIALALAVAVALGALLAGGSTLAWGRLAFVLLAALAALVLAVRAQLRAVPRFAAWLERIEERFPEVRSWLRNALELEASPPPHTSPELAHALAAETARRFETVPVRTLAPRLQPRRPLLVMMGSLLALAILAAVSPARFERSWATLRDPGSAAPPVRLLVEPGSVRVTPGAALAVRARVWGSSGRPRLLLGTGNAAPAVAEGTGPDGEHSWRFDLAQLTREANYQVRLGGVRSPLYRISLAGEPSPVNFEVELHAPDYARLPVQRGATTRGDVAALRGSRARIEVTFDRDLTALEARLPGGVPARFTAVSPRRWRGEFAIDREGEWELHATAGTGAGRYRYRLTPLADAPPVIAVRLPEGDVDLPVGQQVPLEVTGEDDLGLSELELQVHKDPAAPWQRVGLARFPAQPREAQVAARWDASGLGLLPGEVATFRFALYDNNRVGGRGMAVSPTFQLRFPSLAELYDKIDERQGGVQNTLEKVAEQSRELQKSLDRVARQQPATPSPQTSQAFERSEELKSSLQREQDLSRKIDEAAQQLHQSLEQAAERQSFSAELTRKLHEMAELMKQIQSPEFREAMERMKQALENLDRRQLEQALPEWRLRNQEMLARLDRSIELLKKLREEERLDALAKRAEELKRQQDALNREQQARENAGERPTPEDPALAQQQKNAGESTNKLAEDAREAQQQLEQEVQKQELGEAVQELEQKASPAQKQASQSAEKSQHGQARRQGEGASQSLAKAAAQMQSMVSGMRREREGADLAAVRRAAQDLVSLQRESEDNLDSSEPLDRRADRQTDLSEGVSRVTDSLSTLAKNTPFLSSRLQQSLGRAINGLSSSGREFGSGRRQPGEEAGRGGAAALNQAVLELRQTESSMCQNPGGQQGGHSVSQQVGELGEKQGQLNRESRSVAQRLSEQMRITAGDRSQLERLAGEQARIREQLEQVQRDEEQNQQLLGRLDQARREMQEVEEALREGPAGDDLEQKQQRILSRLLDAQRSANRRDYDPQRESRPGEDLARTSAPELPADLMRQSDRLRLDLLKARADQYPAQYRAFIETYLRSLNGSRR
jgi:hypothetical protein